MLKILVLYPLIFAFALIIVPVFMLFTPAVILTNDWQTANRDSANIAPKPTEFDDAIVQVYSARAFNWRAAFGVHTWIAVKPKGANEYTVFQTIGWRLYRDLPVVVSEADIPDRVWFDNKPKILQDIRGKKAEEIIPKIFAASASYPYQKAYSVWPGPNSNTYIAYIARQVPEMQLSLPVTAIGKDYLSNGKWWGKAPSGTGYQFSIKGLLGVTAAKVEGIEFNFLGLNFGIDFLHPAIKWPGIERVGIEEN